MGAICPLQPRAYHAPTAVITSIQAEEFQRTDPDFVNCSQYIDHWGISWPLEDALNNENFAYFDFLVSHGADPNKHSSTESMLRKTLRAKFGGNALARVRFAVERGASIHGSGLLHEAVAKDILDVARYALSQGFNVNEPDPRTGREIPFQTAIMRAIDNDNLRMAELLLTNGADPHIVDNGGDTPSILASKKGFMPVVFLVEQHVDMHPSTSSLIAGAFDACRVREPNVSSTDSMIATPRDRKTFFTLPREIRDAVYSLALIPLEVDIYYLHSKGMALSSPMFPTPSLASYNYWTSPAFVHRAYLLRTNRRIREEASPIFFSRFTFVIPFGRSDPCGTLLKSWLKMPFRKLIRSIRLSKDIALQPDIFSPGCWYWQEETLEQVHTREADIPDEFRILAEHLTALKYVDLNLREIGSAVKETQIEAVVQAVLRLVEPFSSRGIRVNLTEIRPEGCRFWKIVHEASQRL